MKIWIFSALEDSNTYIQGMMCTCVCARPLGWDYMQADRHGEGGVSDMFIGLHNIITLQAYVDRITVPDKNYAMWSSSLPLSLALASSV